MAMPAGLPFDLSVFCATTVVGHFDFSLMLLPIGCANSLDRSFHASIISMLGGTASVDFRSPPAATNSSALIRAAWARLTLIWNCSLFVAINLLT